MAETMMITEADILTEVVAPDKPGIAPELARTILELRFEDQATTRIRGLLAKNNGGTIEPSEAAELEKYLRVGQLLDLLQAKARLSLEHSDASS